MQYIIQHAVHLAKRSGVQIYSFYVEGRTVVRNVKCRNFSCDKLLKVQYKV